MCQTHGNKTLTQNMGSTALRIRIEVKTEEKRWLYKRTHELKMA